MSSHQSQVPAHQVDPLNFRRACARFATGVAVATVMTSDSIPVGITVNSFTSVSLLPPIILICVDHRSNTLPDFRSSAWFGISVLEESQRELSVRFAQHDPACFEDGSWFAGESGVPLLNGALASLECSVNQTVEAGDHTIFLGEVFHARYCEGSPLIYFQSEYRELKNRASAQNIIDQ
ncbi:MAG TPA: flavin reductase family protein [Bryobacteraceae bacterium]|nr:flavin reductase family protein [Bryobacteraceae bacterium]